MLLEWCLFTIWSLWANWYMAYRKAKRLRFEAQPFGLDRVSLEKEHPDGAPLLRIGNVI